MSLTQLVNLPSPSDPANFAAEADNFLTVQLPNLVNEWNTDIALSNLSNTVSTSTTSNSISYGDKTFDVGTGKSYFVGMPLIAANSVSNLIESRVVSYSGSSLVIRPTNIIGSGTFTSWNIYLSPAYVNEDSFKNRIINGAMQIDQRNNGSATTEEWSCDRWSTINSSGVLTKQRVQDSPQGFGYSQKITVTTAGTRNAGDFAVITQKIEGCNIADLNFGSANAKSISLSFWVKSSMTGLFSGGISSGNNNRFYGFTYTITTANVWQKIVVQGVLGDTSGGITEYPTSQGGVAGLIVKLDLGSGSTYQGTANSWNAQTNRLGVSGTVGFAQTSSATFQVTEIQLEKGLLATDFDFRDVQQELARSQRYFEIAQGVVITTANIFKEFPYKVLKAKTVTFSNLSFSSGTGASFIYSGTDRAYQETAHSTNSLFSLWCTAEL